MYSNIEIEVAFLNHLEVVLRYNKRAREVDKVQLVLIRQNSCADGHTSTLRIYRGRKLPRKISLDSANSHPTH